MKRFSGFTLVEVLVVLTIIGILMGLSVFGLVGVRESGRDAKRKTQLQEIRGALELYKSACNTYPLSLPSPGASLTGTVNNPSVSCSTTSIFLSQTPADPLTSSSYFYSSNGTTYTLCASLENGGSDVCTGCATCNYKTVNP